MDDQFRVIQEITLTGDTQCVAGSPSLERAREIVLEYSRPNDTQVVYWIINVNTGEIL